MNKDIKIKLPQDVKYIIDKLYNNGYEGYVVGGCVRDSILNRDIHDWDLTTNAKPEIIMKLFDKVIPTGVKHGTVTIILNNVGYEITTYRLDNECDGRHAKVEFCNTLKEDLARRDFTINAMAYNDKEGLIDYFGGLEDLNSKTIRFVGNAEDRIKEDYLRILRAIRFSFQLGFYIKPFIPHFHCYREIQVYIADIKDFVSKERIRDEFNKILNCFNFKSNHKFLKDLLYSLDLEAFLGVSQNNPYHIYDVLEHSILAMTCVDTLELKLTMLLHDIGKGQCKIKDKNGIDHFYGHAKASKEIAEKWLTKYKYDNKTKNTVLILIENHDIQFNANKKFVKRMLNKLGEENFRKLIKVRKADIVAQNPQYTANRLEKVYKVERILEEVIKEKECFQLKDLEVDGYDMINIGLRGKDIGEVLNKLLNKVIEGVVVNSRDVLLEEAYKICNKK